LEKLILAVHAETAGRLAPGKPDPFR
jgi:hypothetical protein